MSAFMMSNETLSKLANLITRYYVSNDSMGFYFPEELTKELGPLAFDAEMVFHRLADLNVKSLRQRYPSDYYELIDDVEYMPNYDMWKYSHGVQPWHYQFLKSLRCYLYQSCEGDCYDTGLYKALDKLSMELAYFIATNSPEYELAEWE